MASNTSYSFEDVSCVFYHPLAGQNQVNGTSVGSVSYAFADDSTTQQVAADGSVMTSKNLSRRGTVTLELQQTSPFNKWLVGHMNTVDASTTSEWVQWQMTLAEGYDNGLIVTATHGAPQKKYPERKNSADGDMVTWTFMFSDMVEA